MKTGMVRGFEEVKDILSPAVGYTIKKIEEYYQLEGEKLKNDAKKVWLKEMSDKTDELKEAWNFLQKNYGKSVDYSRLLEAHEYMAGALYLYLKYIESELKKMNIKGLIERKKRIEDVLKKYYPEIPKDKYIFYYYFQREK